MKNSLLVLLAASMFLSCSPRREEQKYQENERNKAEYSDDNDNADYSEESDETENLDENENSEYSEEGDCNLEDGTYSATVDYNNSETGYSATYTVDVEVQDCQVIQIDFPNGGYIDSDHITPADIDEDGQASVEGESGRTYEVEIDN